MGRPLRMKMPGLTYHITSRARGRQLLLEKTADKKALCKLLKKTLTKYGVILYGFSLMNNHFHMMIRIDNKADLSQVLGEFKCAYAKYFNKKYGHCGPVWNDRFRSTIIQDDRYALACLRYIDRNPVRAGLVDHPSKWRLGSFQAYAYGQNHPILPLQPHPTYLALSEAKDQRRAFYLELVMENNSLDDELASELSKRAIFGSDEFIDDICSRLN